MSIRCDAPGRKLGASQSLASESPSTPRASFSMEPAFYAEVPQNIAEKIIGARQEAAEK